MNTVVANELKNLPHCGRRILIIASSLFTRSDIVISRVTRVYECVCTNICKKRCLGISRQQSLGWHSRVDASGGLSMAVWFTLFDS